MMPTPNTCYRYILKHSLLAGRARPSPWHASTAPSNQNASAGEMWDKRLSCA